MCYWGGEGQEAVLAILGRGEGGVVVVVVIMAMLGRGEGRGSRRRCRRCCCCCCCCYESWRWKSPCRELARPHTSMSLHTRRVALATPHKNCTAHKAATQRLYNTSQECHSTQAAKTCRPTSQECHSTQGRNTATIQHPTRLSQHTGREDVSPLQHSHKSKSPVAAKRVTSRLSRCARVASRPQHDHHHPQHDARTGSNSNRSGRRQSRTSRTDCCGSAGSWTSARTLLGTATDRCGATPVWPKRRGLPQSAGSPAIDCCVPAAARLPRCARARGSQEGRPRCARGRRRSAGGGKAAAACGCVSSEVQTAAAWHLHLDRCGCVPSRGQGRPVLVRSVARQLCGLSSCHGQLHCRRRPSSVSH